MKKVALPHRGQAGITLVISLVMLVVLTLFAVTMIKLGNNSLEVVGNMQAQKATEAAAQLVVEDVVSSVQKFNDAVAIDPATLVCGQDSVGDPVNWVQESGLWVCNTTANAYTVKLSMPECVYFETAPGYALDETPGYVPPEDTVWDVKAVATDTLTGAESEIHQGVRIRRTKGNCP